jgi:hypothetical protein
MPHTANSMLRLQQFAVDFLALQPWLVIRRRLELAHARGRLRGPAVEQQEFLFHPEGRTGRHGHSVTPDAPRRRATPCSPSRRRS